MLPQVEPTITVVDIEAVTEYLKSGGWITEHKVTEEFERAIAEFLGVRHCILVTSGTVAIALSIMAVSNYYYKNNLEFAIPDYTMMGTARAVQLANRGIRLVDIDKNTLCMDLDKLANISSSKLCGVIYVSINGRCGDMEQLVKLCKEKNWLLIEDACQSFGSSYNGKPLGTFGDIGCYSLSPHKIITTGQGGIIVTNDDIHAINIRALKDQGRSAPGTESYPALGFNFKFTDLQASLGLSQFKQMKQRIERKRYIYDCYFKRLCDISIKLPIPNVPWFIDIYLENRDTLFYTLKAHNIGSRKVYPPVHTQFPFCFTTRDKNFPHSTFISEHGLFLPSSLNLTEEIIDNICNVIIKNTSNG
jgi:perosamine synthetase